MKRFVMKSCLLAALVFGPMAAVLLLPLPHAHILSPMLDKIALLKGGERDRLIFVSGSGLFSGLDSELVQKQLGRPVVNLGLYAGFGTTPLLREVRPYLRPGDAVVIVPEYGVLFDRYDYQARRFLFALAPARNFLPLYGNTEHPVRAFVTDLYALVQSKFSALPQAVRDAVSARSPGPLGRRGYVDYGRYFNANGDSTRGFRTAPSPDMLRQRGEDYFNDPHRGFADQSVAAINAFCRDAGELGVETFFVFPAYPEPEYERQAAGMRRYEQRLREELICPILGGPKDFLYPYAFFTDTTHHLGIAGKRPRTERMIALLKTVPGLQRTAARR